MMLCKSIARIAVQRFTAMILLLRVPAAMHFLKVAAMVPVQRIIIVIQHLYVKNRESDALVVRIIALIPNVRATFVIQHPYVEESFIR